MKDSLKPGLQTSRSIEVDAARCISFMGDEGRVYATPALVGDVEYACRDFLLEHLDEGEDSVGTRVEIDHLAATPFGMSATIEVTIAEIDGRSVTFEFIARDPEEDIARGRHMRFVVDVARTAERIKTKAARAKT